MLFAVKMIVGGMAGGLAVVTAMVLRENIAQVRRGKVVDRAQAVLLIAIPTVLLATWLFVIALIAGVK